jgi:HSP20 family protein
MTKSRKRNPFEQVPSAMILEAGEIIDRLSVGNWIPSVDICETTDAVVIRVELPGIDPANVRLSIQGNVLRVHGVKQEPAAARARLSYYCLERRYGRFDRQIAIDWVVDAGRARANLANGILMIQIPRIENRRGALFEIPIQVKPG